MDGDRLVIVKNKKKYAPDITLGLGIAKTMELGYKKFVISIDTSIGIEKYILDMGGKIYRSKVGEINVIEKIQDTKSHAGGEGSSGGFIFPEFNLCRDGILTSGLISSMEDDKIDKILDYMNKFHQIRYKFNIKSDFHNSILDNVFEKIKFHSQIDTLDGIKIMMDDYSWVLIRKSNTEEAIRISIESDTIEKVKSIKQKINSIICTSHEQIKRKRYNKDF